MSDRQPEAPAPIDYDVWGADFGQVGWRQPEAPAVPGDQAEARAVCDHFYASHCYRGMCVRLCMLCHAPDWDDLERQLAGAREPAGEPLTPAECDRLRRMVTEHVDALSAVRKALDLAAGGAGTDEVTEVLAAARDGLRVLEGSEEEGT